MVLALEKIKNPRRYRSVFECHVWVFWRYWKESTLKNRQAIERRNMMLKKTRISVVGLAFLERALVLVM
jgi:hypothetical protein